MIHENKQEEEVKEKFVLKKKILKSMWNSYVIWIGHVWVNVSKTIMVIFHLN